MPVYCTVFGILLITVCVVAQMPPEAQLPEGYVLNVEQICGSEGVSNTTLCVKTDLEVDVKVLCDGGYAYDFINMDGVTYFAYVFFDGDSAQRCVYPRLSSEGIYTVEVMVNIIDGEGDSNINREVRYQMTCTYDQKGKDTSSSKDVREQFFAAKEVQSLVGDETNMGVSVFLTDILGQPLDTPSIPTDKVVCLKVFLNNDTGLLTDPDVSVYPVSCEAVGSDTGHRHVMLRSGCGDGIIFSKLDGFDMAPRAAISPYFRYFHLEDDRSMRIMCNFTLCSSCVGKNSCSGDQDRDRSIFSLFGEWIEAGNKLKRSAGGIKLLLRAFNGKGYMAKT